MDKLDIVLWALGTGFAFIFGLMAIMWHSLNARIDKSDKEFSSRFDKMDKDFSSRLDRTDQKIDKLDEKVTDIDRRLCRLEGAFSSKDCCMIKDDRQMKKAE